MAPSQESEMMNAHVEKTMKFIEESTTLKEQLRCFVCCYALLLLPYSTLSSAFLVWFLYFLLTIVTTCFRDELNISSDGWKEKCTLKKCAVLIQLKASRLLELDDIITPANKDAATQVDDEQLGAKHSDEESNDSDLAEEAESVNKCEGCALESVLREQLEESNVVINALRQDVDYLSEEVADLECMLDASQNLKTELHASKAECSKLHELLMSKQGLEEELNQMKANLEFEKTEAAETQRILEDDKAQLRNSINQIVIQAANRTEQHRLLVSKLNETIEALEIQMHEMCVQTSEYEWQCKLEIAGLDYTIENLESDKEELLERLSVEAVNADHFRALSSQYKVQHEVEEAKLKQTIEELHNENYELHGRLLAADDKFVYLLEASSDRLEKNEVEKFKLNELEHEMHEQNAELANAYATIEHLRALSSEYKEAIESLEQEKYTLLTNLQKANESAELHNKLLDLDYAIV